MVAHERGSESKFLYVNVLHIKDANETRPYCVLAEAELMPLLISETATDYS